MSFTIHQSVNRRLTDCLVLAEAQRFTATTCGAPVRSQQRRLYGVSWGLYGLSCLAVLARFTSRSSFLKGAGYGLDDYTIALTQLVMTAITVSAHLSRSTVIRLCDLHTNPRSGLLWTRARHVDAESWRYIRSPARELQSYTRRPLISMLTQTSTVVLDRRTRLHLVRGADEDVHHPLLPPCLPRHRLYRLPKDLLCNLGVTSHGDRLVQPRGRFSMQSHLIQLDAMGCSIQVSANIPLRTWNPPS